MILYVLLIIQRSFIIFLIQYEVEDLDIFLSPNELGFSYPRSGDHTYPPFLQLRYALLTRGPKPILDISNLLRPFPLIVWGLVAFTMAAVMCYFQLTYVVYSSLPLDSGLISEGAEADKIALKTLSTLTEPERFSCFASWSGGIK